MAKINIETSNRMFETEKSLYGLFFEDINRSGDGGLYPELIRNRAFEDSIYPEDLEERDGENADIRLNREDALNKKRQAALEIDFSPNGRIYNVGYIWREGFNRIYFTYARGYVLRTWIKRGFM